MFPNISYIPTNVSSRTFPVSPPGRKPRDVYLVITKPAEYQSELLSNVNNTESNYFVVTGKEAGGVRLQ